MADDLGGRLLAADLANAQQVADAARDRMALAPALVASGVDEYIIEAFLRGEGFESEPLVPDEGALAYLPGNVAHRLWALPLRMDEEGLVVAMADPSDMHTTRELSLISGALLVPRVATVSALRAELGRAYPDDIPSFDRVSEPDLAFELTRPRTPPRGLGRDSEPPATPDGYVPLVRPKSTPTDVEVPLELTRRTSSFPDEVGVATRRFSKPPGVAMPRISTPPGPLGTPASTADADDPEISVETLDNTRAGGSGGQSSTQGWSANVTARRVQQGSSIEIELADSWDDLDAPSSDVRGPAEPSTSAAPRNVRRSYANRAPRAPGDIGTTLAQMRTLRDRDAVLTMACEATLLVARAAVFLALRGQVLRGWSGLGGSLTADAVRNLWIPVSTPSMFRGVVLDGATYAGPYGASAADNLFRAATGSRGGIVVVCPVEVMGKTVAVLVADDVRYSDDGRDRVETLSQAVSDALKRIILARKS